MATKKELTEAAKEIAEKTELLDDNKEKVVITKETSNETLVEIITFVVENPDPGDEFSQDTEKVLDEFRKRLGYETKEPPENNIIPAEDILDEIEFATNLTELKEILDNYDQFKQVRSKLKVLKDLEDLRERMAAVLNVDKKANIENEPPKEKEPEKAKVEEKILKINPRFEASCPKLTDDEFSDLEKLILKDGKVLTPIITWKGQVVDGHNRYKIALANDLLFDTLEKEFADEDAVVVWIKENAISQRNLPEYARFELIKEIEKILKIEGKENQATRAKDKPKEKTPHNTRKELAKKTGLSEGKIAKAKVIEKKADEETKEKLRTGKKTIAKAYEEVKEKKAPAKATSKNAALVKLLNAARGLRQWGKMYEKYEATKEFTHFAFEVAEMIDKKAKETQG